MPPVDTLPGRGTRRPFLYGYAVTPDRRAALALGIVLFFAMGLRLTVAVSWPSISWPDEIFQTMEQAHRLVFGYGVIPWEFRTGARSWLLPGTLAAAMELGRPFGGLGHVRAAQAALALLSLAPVFVAFRWTHRRHGVAAAVAAGLAAATWFELVYFSSRAFSEAVAAHVAIAALYLASEDEQRASRVLLAGVAFGLTVVLRVHLAPAVGVALAVAGGRDGRRWRCLLAGASASVLFAGLLDATTWSGPFSSFWEYLRYNVIEGNSARLCVKPWHAYFTRLGAVWSWGTAAVLGLAVAGAVRRPAAVAFAVAALATHSAIAQKEYRFAYPVVAVVVLLASEGLGELVARLRAPRAVSACALAVAWAALSGWRATAFESDGSCGFTRPGESMWHQQAVGIEAMERLRTDPDVCGVALVRVHWAWTGGYAYLHRDIPLYDASDGRLFRLLEPAFNAVLVTRELLPVLRGYTVDRCWENTCLAKRAGTCAAGAEPTLNQWLEYVGG
ncbi:MAG: hypothetical protein FJ207_15345 [Gemmatimonadetes bacterium]|nr:hypothetical protein [Gemmatimonadota bacterium]